MKGWKNKGAGGTAKVSHGFVFDCSWTALLTVWEGEERGLLDFTSYARQRTARLDRKSTCIQRKCCLGHLNLRKAPVSSRSTSSTSFKEEISLSSSGGPPKPARSERRWKNHTKIFLFGTNQTGTEEIYPQTTAVPQGGDSGNACTQRGAWRGRG